MTSVRLPWPPPDLSPNARTHWSVRSRASKAYREQCYWLTKASKLTAPETERIALRLDFFPPDRRHRDGDNALASAKNGIDGLADALGVNDRRFDTSFTIHRDDPQGYIVARVEAV